MGQEEQFRFVLRGQFGNQILVEPSAEHGPLVKGQLVTTEVLDAEGDGAFELGPQIGGRLAFHPVDQIDRHRFQPGFNEHPCRRLSLGHRMKATEELEFGVDQGLHPEAHEADPEFEPPRDILR